MRRYSASVRATVDVTESAARPIRLQLGVDTYAMNKREALDLANQLVDACERETP